MCELRTDARWQMLACSCDCNLVIKVPSCFDSKQLYTCILKSSDQMLLCSSLPWQLKESCCWLLYSFILCISVLRQGDTRSLYFSSHRPCDNTGINSANQEPRTRFLLDYIPCQIVAVELFSPIISRPSRRGDSPAASRDSRHAAVCWHWLPG